MWHWNLPENVPCRCPFPVGDFPIIRVRIPPLLWHQVATGHAAATFANLSTLHVVQGTSHSACPTACSPNTVAAPRLVSLNVSSTLSRLNSERAPSVCLGRVAAHLLHHGVLLHHNKVSQWLGLL